MRLSRRALLAAAGRAVAGALLLAGALPVLARRGAGAGAPLSALSGSGDAAGRVGRLAASVREPESAAWLGRRYLESAPDEADPERLAAALTADLPPGLEGAPLRRALAERRRGDFARRDVVVLDGWVLSRSELRLCALVALERGLPVS